MLCSLLLFSCRTESPTIVNGLVVDTFTGDPIEGVSLLFLITHKPQADGSSNTEYSYINTNANGQFYFEHDLPIRLFDAKKLGYVSKGGGTQIAVIGQGEVNDITIKMIPKDGFLNLLFENSTNQADSVYVAVYSPSQFSEASISNGVIFREGVLVQNTNLENRVISLASEEIIDIYWGFSPLPYNITASPFHDSIYIQRNDTTSFSVSF